MSDFAVLCRTRNQFETIAKALRDHHVPYQETGTVAFFQEEPFQSFTDLVSAFTLESYERAAPLFNIKKRQVSKLQFEMARAQLLKSNLIPFLTFIRENLFPSEIFNDENWVRFKNLAGEMKNIDEFLRFTKLGIGADTYSKNLEAVSLMTLHASKGLEFECVFIPGNEDGLLPYNLYQKEVDLEEEKRLLYVGMTRAKKMLYLTYAKNRNIRGRNFRLQKSPFLGSIQQELIQQIKNKPPKKEAEKDNQLSLFD